MSQLIYPLRMVSNQRYHRLLKSQTEINALKKKIAVLEKQKKPEERREDTQVDHGGKPEEEETAAAAQMSGEGFHPEEISNEYREEKDLPGRSILGEDSKTKNKPSGEDLLGQGSVDPLEKVILSRVWTKNHGKVKRLLSLLRKNSVSWDTDGVFKNTSLSGLKVQYVIPITVQGGGNHHMPENIKKWCNYLRDHNMDIYISNSALLSTYAWYYIGD